MKVTREQALRILCQVTDKDNFWEMACERVIGFDDLGDGEGPYPDIWDVFAALGVSRGELDKALNE